VSSKTRYGSEVEYRTSLQVKREATAYGCGFFCYHSSFQPWFLVWSSDLSLDAANPSFSILLNLERERLLAHPNHSCLRRPVVVNAAQRVSALVAGGRAAIGYGDGSHQVQLLVALERRGPLMPDSGDHRELLACGSVQKTLDVVTASSGIE